MRSRAEAGPALTQGTTVDWRRPRPGGGVSASRRRGAEQPRRCLPMHARRNDAPSAHQADRRCLVCLPHGLGGPCTTSAAVGASCAPRAAAEPRPRCLQGGASPESECAISVSAASTMARVFAAGYLRTATRRAAAARAARPRPLSEWGARARPQISTPPRRTAPLAPRCGVPVRERQEQRAGLGHAGEGGAVGPA